MENERKCGGSGGVQEKERGGQRDGARCKEENK